MYEVITDVTAFYPNSGGQPADHGTLAGADVVDVVERGDTIVHLTVTSVPIGPAAGRIDIERRFDHMQQHTGQHVLSSAFMSLFMMETIGFHLGNETVTIDLNVPDVSPDQTAAAERLACEVIFQNRPIRCGFYEPEEIDVARLRKTPTVKENIRLVDIEGFDLSPCGGTHCRATGEVGLIKIIRTERMRGYTRVEFLCGRRALADYRWKNNVIHMTASALSVHGNELPQAVERLQGQLRDLRRELDDTSARLREYQVEELYSNAEPIGPHGVRVIARSCDGEGLDQLKAMAHKICEKPMAVALLGSANGESAHMVFEKSQDVCIDVSKLLQEILPIVDGKGGGTPIVAQGGGKKAAHLPMAITGARELASSLLTLAGSERVPENPLDSRGE